ncbi:uncharacterized protein LOC144807763 [Lissotriton helveticus]
MTLGLLPRTVRLARRSMTPLMGRILAVTHIQLDARLKEHRQQGRDSPVDTEGQEPDTSGGETSTTAAQEPSDTEVTSASEGNRSMQEESLPETQITRSSDASGDASMLASTRNGDSASSSTTQQPVPTLPFTSSGAARVHVSKRGRVTFTPGTAEPAPVPPAALSAESVELLHQLCVGQTALLNAFSDHDKKLGQVVAYMEGIDSNVGGLHRTVQALSSTVTSALQQAHTPIPALVPLSIPQLVATSDDNDHGPHASQSRHSTRSTQQQQPKRARPQTPSPQKSKASPECKDKSPSGKSKAEKAKKQKSGSHASEASPAKGFPVPKALCKARRAVSVPTEEVLYGKGTPRKGSEPHSPTTSTPIPSPVELGKEGTVRGTPAKQGKEGQRSSQMKRSTGSSTSPAGVPGSAPDAALLVCVPVVSSPVPINPSTEFLRSGKAPFKPLPPTLCHRSA